MEKEKLKIRNLLISKVDANFFLENRTFILKLKIIMLKSWKEWLWPTFDIHKTYSIEFFFKKKNDFEFFLKNF